jgi:hypothetical protein
MRILTIRRMFTLAAIGVAYVHGKRRGELTLASISDTLNYLWSSTADRFGAGDRAQHRTPPRTGTINPTSTPTANGLTGDRMRRPHDA